MKSRFLKLTIFLATCLIFITEGFAQCPTVSNDTQIFCNIESLLISDLEATDNGGGLAWFDTATSTTPLNNSLSLIDGENYFADNSAGNCGSRIEVTVTIVGAPLGLNFQGVCVENPEDATIIDLEVVGNDVQWYLTPIGGSPLDVNSVLLDETIYYVDQSNPTTNCRTSRLAIFVNVGIVPVPLGETVQQFCANQDNIPTVGDLIASGNNNWYLSQSSASPLDLDTPLINGNTYFATTIDPPCESESRLEVVVEIIFQDSAGLNGSLDICEDDTNTYDLFDSLNGSPEIGGTWSPTLNSNTGIFNPTLDPEGTYTYTVASTNPECENASAFVTVTVVLPPNAGMDGTLEICENDTNTFDLFDSLNGSPEMGGTWSPSLTSGSGIFNPTVDAEGTYTYTITSPNVICNDVSASVTVSFALPPNAGNNGTLDICENDTNTYDLFDSLNDSPDMGGTWSPTLTSNTGVFDPALDSEGTYTYTLISNNSICEDASALVTVTIIPPPNAGMDGALEICENDTTTYDLFDSLTGSPEIGGTWSPTLTSGSGIFDPTLDAEGTYTYTVTSENGVCNEVSAAVTVSFVIPPDAGNDGALDICEDDTNIYNLFDSLNGSPEMGGTWSPALASGSGLFDSALDAEGTYTYTITSINPICEDVSASVIVSVIPPPNAGMDGALEICENDTTTYDLFDSLTGSPEMGGTWSPGLNSGSGIFDPTLDSEGTYTYTVASGSAICGTASAAVTVSFALPPNAGNDGSLDICEDDTNTYDLFDSLIGSPEMGGIWSPTLASGSGIFDPALDAEGTYTYTITSINPICEDASASVIVSVIPPPNAGMDGALEICENDTNTYDLFDSLNGSPQTGGTWSPTLNSGTGIFDPTLDSEGTYTYTVASGNAICGAASATVIVSLSTPPDAGNDGSLDICEDDTATYDLFDSLSGSPETGGTWSPALASSSGLFDPELDTEGTYTYTLTSSNPLCEDASASVIVSIIPLPNAGIDGALEICENDTSTYDLIDSLTGSPDANGTWSPALASGTGIFDPTLDGEGTYTYTVASGTATCGTATASVVVSFATSPNAGNDGSLDICEDDTNTYDLFDSLDGSPEIGGTWSPALASGTGVFDPTLDNQSNYTYTITSNNTVCEDATASVIVSIILPPNAGTDGTLEICQNDTNTYDLFDSLGDAPNLGGTWSPALTSGSGIFDPALDAEGTYTYTLELVECMQTDTSEVIVTFNPLPDIKGLTISIIDTCQGEDLEVILNNAFNLDDGDYNISYDITGANTISQTIVLTIVNGEASFFIDSDEFVISGLHQFVISSLSNVLTSCNADVSTLSAIDFIILESILPELIDDGNSFCLDDEPTIAALSSNIINANSNGVDWYDAETNGTMFSSDEPLEDGVTYYASVISEEGCESAVRLAVTVSVISCIEDIIIPDGFSPNGDGINETFDIKNLDVLYPNFKLTIYNRYGNILYEGNINTPQWNGISNSGRSIGNDELPVGVYFFILEFKDGIRKELQGRVYLNR